MRKLALALGLAWACLALPAHAQGYSPAAQRVLERARAATGGSGWYALRGWHETGREGAVRYEAWLDPIRYGQRVERHEPGGRSVRGFNGMADWRIAPTGATTGVDDRAALAEARTEAFFRGHFFFYPGRYDGRGKYVGVRRSQGRAFEVVEVQPWGGRPRELWFDASSHRLSRIVDRTAPRPVTVEVSDYRRAGPVTVPFHYTIDDGTPGGRRERQVETLAFAPTDRDLFSLPRAAPAPPVIQVAAAPPKPKPPKRWKIWKRSGDSRERLPMYDVPQPR